jgi:hypothetical protein
MCCVGVKDRNLKVDRIGMGAIVNNINGKEQDPGILKFIAPTSNGASPTSHMETQPQCLQVIRDQYADTYLDPPRSRNYRAPSTPPCDGELAVGLRGSC